MFVFLYGLCAGFSLFKSSISLASWELQWGADYANKVLVNHLLTLRNSAIFEFIYRYWKNLQGNVLCSCVSHNDEVQSANKTRKGSV